MKTFFIGLLLNIATGLFNIPLGPERYIKRLYRSMYSVINIDLDNTTKKIADTMICIAAVIVVFLIVWTLTEIYNIIPFPFIRESVLSVLLCVSLRLSQNDNLAAAYLLKYGKKDNVMKLLQKRGFSSDKNIYPDMLKKRSDTVRLIICPIFFYICFGIITVFLYKTIEILSRTKDNWAAKIAHNIMEFVPAFLFGSIMRLTGSIIKRRVISGASVYDMLCSYLRINSAKNNILSTDIISSELLIYISITLFCFLSYALMLMIGCIKALA